MRPDPCPVIVDGLKPAVCVCGVCGRKVSNVAVAKVRHMRVGCFVDGVQNFYRKRFREAQFRRVIEPTLVL